MINSEQWSGKTLGTFGLNLEACIRSHCFRNVVERSYCVQKLV